MVRLLVLLVLFLPATAPARDVQVEVRDHGLYDLVTTGRYEAPRTASGTAHTVTDLRLIRETDIVVAQPDVHFGYRYRILGGLQPGDELIARTVHPPLTNPETGETTTVSEIDVPLPINVDNQYDGYSFDHRWEMAEGLWRFQLILNGELIHEQLFRVVIPLN